MFRKIFIILVLFSARIIAQNDIPGLIYKGLDYSYNFQFQQAEDCFQQIINKYPNDPRGYHYKSGIYLWIYLSNKSKPDLERFTKLSDLAIDKSEKVLDDKDNDENALYVLGANYGFRAMVYAKENSSVNALWAARNSNKYLNKTLEYYPHNNDAYMGKGIFSFALTYVPGMFKWALKLAGFSGSRDEGLRYLHQAYKYGRYAKTEAAYYLSQIYSESLADYNSALGYLAPLIKKYPQNTLFQYSYAVVLIKDRRPKEAEKYLKDIIKADNQKFTQVTAFSYFLLGDINFRQGNYQQAILEYQKFLSSTHDFDYSGIAYYRIGLCYELSKNRREAQHNYLLARNGNLDIEDDAFAKRKSEIYFDRALTENEIALIRYSGLLESGRFNEAFDSLNLLLARLGTSKLKAEAYLYLSDASFEMGKVNESVDFANKAVKVSSKEEPWIKPFALYYAARAYQRLGNRTTASNFIEEASDITDYDYKAKLTGFLEALKMRL